jgi:hypothetical protein
MTHDELSKKLEGLWHDSYKAPGYAALRAVVELHKPDDDSFCGICTWSYPCITVQAIEKELE